MKKYLVTINGKKFDVEVEEKASGAPEQKEDTFSKDEKGVNVLAPLPGTVSLQIKEGDKVSEGDVIFILEAMKMENEITASNSGFIKAIKVSDGDSVDTGDVLAVIG